MAASSPSSAFKCPQQRLHNFIIPGKLKWGVTSVNHTRVRKSAASYSSYRSSTSGSDGNNNNVNNHLVALHGPEIGNSAMASPSGTKKRKEKPEKQLGLLNSPVDNSVNKNKFVIRLKTLTSSTVSDQTKSSTDLAKSSKSADAGTAAIAAADVADQAADAAAGDYISVMDAVVVVADAAAGDYTSVVDTVAVVADAVAGDHTSVVDAVAVVADAAAGDHTSVVTVAVVADEEEEVLIKSWDFRPRRAVSKSKPPANGNRGELRNGGADAQETKTQQQNRPVLAKAGEKKGKPKNQVIVPDMSIPLSKEEIEEDIFALTGSKPSRKPNKRPKNVQKQIDCLFPGTWLPKVTPDDYKVTESKWKG